MIGGSTTINLPFGNPSTTFDLFLRTLLTNYHKLVFEFKAFTHMGKIRIPAQFDPVHTRLSPGIDLFRQANHVRDDR